MHLPLELQLEQKWVNHIDTTRINKKTITYFFSFHLTWKHCSISWNPITKRQIHQTKGKQNTTIKMGNFLPFPLLWTRLGDKSNISWIRSHPPNWRETRGCGERKSFSCFHLLTWVLFTFNTVILPMWKTLSYSLSGWGQAV